MKVVVVGAGIVGAACARRLAHDGHQVVIVDRGGTSAGTSAAGEGNILVSDKEPGPELELARYGARRWVEVAAELAAELHDSSLPPIEYEPKGGLVVARTETDATALHRLAEAQRAAGVDARDIGIADALDSEPWLNPDLTAAVSYPEDAQVQPVLAAEALLASARRAGAEVRTHDPVLAGVVADGNLVGVRTRVGRLDADAVVVAAGPWSRPVSALLGAELPVLPRRGMVLVTSRLPPRITHKVYDADYVGAVGSDDADLQTSTVVESTGAGTVLIGSSRQRIGFDERLQPRVLAELAAKAAGIFPFLTEVPVIRCYGGFRPYMPDHLPVIGPDHRLRGLWHDTGHEGAGVGLSVAAADLLADQLAGRTPAVDPALFRTDRPSLAPFLGDTQVAA